jgi:heme exporter protein A
VKQSAAARTTNKTISMQGSTTEICLQAHELGCVRDDRELFSDLSFSLQPHQALLVEGRNGSGKSTLLRILCGIREQDSGEVSWCGKPVNRLGSAYHAHLTYVGHQDGNKLDLTALENLRVAQALDKPSSLAPEEALDRVGLYGYEDILVRNMSAGQRRRLALARLLVIDCRLWILDEPYTALDRESRVIFHEQLENHTAQGGMLVMAAHHDLELQNIEVNRINLST